jgi:hypothetical protein
MTLVIRRTFTASMCFRRPERPAPKPKGQESLAQGSPWVNQNKRFALKGLKIATRSGRRFGASSRCAWWPFQG